METIQGEEEKEEDEEWGRRGECRLISNEDNRLPVIVSLHSLSRSRVFGVVQLSVRRRPACGRVQLEVGGAVPMGGVWGGWGRVGWGWGHVQLDAGAAV